MATINISNLRPAGSQLFSDSENYMSELGDNELVSVNGGFLIRTPFIPTTVPLFSPRLTPLVRHLKRPNN